MMGEGKGSVGWFWGRKEEDGRRGGGGYSGG